MRWIGCLGLVAGLLVACGGSDDVVSSPSPAPNGAWLVWSTDGDRSETVWIDANGAEVARKEGVHLAAGAHVWRIERHEGRVTGLDCDCVGRADPSMTTTPDACKTAVPTQVVTAVDLLSTEHFDLVTAPTAVAALDGESSPGVAATIVSTVGPYVFLETSGYSYGCGAAHGNGWVGYEVIDATTAARSVVEVVTPAEASAIKTTEAAGTLARQQAAEGAAFDPQTFTLTEVRPRWQADGKLVAEAQLTWDACYACSDGLWGSYSRSARIPTRVPERLLPHATTPAPVLAWWSAHPPPLTGGWSAVPPDQAEAALAAFRR